MAVVYVNPGGWKYGREQPRRLATSATPINYGSILGNQLPERVDPRSWMRIEDQRDQGSCAGHALSTGIECLYASAGGSVAQLSRACAYYMAQRVDGIQGDEGSTISGGIQMAINDGICEESVWPYPSRYDPRIPEAYRTATRWKIAGHSPCRSYDDVIRHIAIHGAVHIGILWSEDIDRQVSRTGILNSYRQSGGGHSVELIGYLPHDWENKLEDKPLVMLFNSWSKQWGRDGICLVAPTAIQSMFDGHMNVFEGLIGGEFPNVQPPVIKDL